MSRAAEEAAMEHANVLNPAIGISMGDGSPSKDRCRNGRTQLA